MEIKLFFFLLFFFIVFSAHAADLNIKPEVSISAKSWNLKPGPPQRKDGRETTIIVNPAGKEFNIGESRYPDSVPTTLWIVGIKELRAKFLIIKTSPSGTAHVPTSIIYIAKNDVPKLAAVVETFLETGPNPNDKPGYNPTVPWDEKQHIKDFFFEDVDKDGTPELTSNTRSWKSGGTKTWYKFTKDKTFVPYMIDEYADPTSDDSDKLVWKRLSRKILKPTGQIEGRNPSMK